MSQSAKKSQQDEFEITLESRFLKIRQDRLPLRPGEASVKIGAEAYPVIDISSFGLAIEAPMHIKFNSDLRGQVYSGNSLILTVDLTPVRSEPFQERQKIAFETRQQQIPIISVFGARDLKQILDSHKLFFNLDQIDPHFKAITFQMSYWLKTLESKINSLEITTFDKSRSELDEYENVISQTVAQYIAESVTPAYAQLEALTSGFSSKDKKRHFEFFRSVLGEHLFQSYYANRAYSKPLGYAGDFEMMRTVYNRELRGSSLFGRCVERYFTEVPEAQAVRNRGRYLQGKIVHLLKQNPHAKILSVASGPAQEVQFLVEENESLISKCQIHLLDQDLDALKLSQRAIDKILRSKNSQPQIHFQNYAIKNIIESGAPEKDFDLIYTAGLFDYLTPPVAQAAAKQLFNSLAPGGALVIGNFDVSAPNRFGMSLVTDWNLIYRTEEELIDLFSFLGPVKIEQEPLGINLFAIICK